MSLCLFEGLKLVLQQKNNRLVRLAVLYVCFTLLPSPGNVVFAQGYFLIDDDVEEIYHSILDLKFEKAKFHIRRIKEPLQENLMLVHLENYIDFFTIFINENPDEFKRLEKNKNARLRAIRKGDKTSPYYNFIQAEILLQWAISRLKFEEYYTALTEVRKAHHLLIENKKKFPDFMANNKSLAMIHAILGTLPDNYRYLLKLFTGMEGTIPQSINEIKSVIEYSDTHFFLFREESYVIYALISLHLENKKEKAWEIISRAQLDAKNSPLAVFMIANLARHTGRTDYAISILTNRPQGKEYMDFYFLDFLLGLNKLNRLDDDADIYLKKYVAYFKGSNYIREAYQKLAWYSWIHENDKIKALMYYEKCIEKGNSLVDEDKSALEEARNGKLPNQILLKSRLLFDGGYYKRSLEVLIENKELISKTYFLAYNYRMGRNYHLLKAYEKAAKFYLTVLNTDANTSYYKCNAALQMALIHELRNDKSLSIHYFKKCLALNPNKYQSSLHQKAKAGLNRINN